MTSVNVLGSGVVLGVVREVDCRFVVDMERCGFRLCGSELVEKGAEVHGFFGRLRRGDDLGLAARQ
eukprot:6196068-Pleurochrysis_carterae.AAC.1